MTYKIIGGDHKEYGPETAEQVRQWIAEGRANGQTLAKAEGSSEWKPLSAHPEFSELSARVPPTISSGLPAVFTGVPADAILAIDTDLDVPACLSRGWELLRGNFGELFGATALIWLISFVVRFIPLVGIFLQGVLFGGLYVLYLKRIRGQTTSLGDAFSGFGQQFVHLLLAGFLSALLGGLGYIFCIIPGIYLQTAWIFCVPLAADKRFEFWSAMELSRKVVTRVWFKVFGLLLVVFAPLLVAAIFVAFKNMVDVMSVMQPLLNSSSPDVVAIVRKAMEVATRNWYLQIIVQVVLLFNLPFAVAALMYAYEDLFNPRTAPAA